MSANDTRATKPRPATSHAAQPKLQVLVSSRPETPEPRTPHLRSERPSLFKLRTITIPPWLARIAALHAGNPGWGGDDSREAPRSDSQPRGKRKRAAWLALAGLIVGASIGAGFPVISRWTDSPSSQSRVAPSAPVQEPPADSLPVNDSAHERRAVNTALVPAPTPQGLPPTPPSSSARARSTTAPARSHVTAGGSNARLVEKASEPLPPQHAADRAPTAPTPPPPAADHVTTQPSKNGTRRDADVPPSF